MCVCVRCELNPWLRLFDVSLCRTFLVRCPWRKWRSSWAYTNCAVAAAGTSRAVTPAAVWVYTRGWTGSHASWWLQEFWMWPEERLPTLNRLMTYISSLSVSFAQSPCSCLPMSYISRLAAVCSRGSMVYINGVL